MLINRITDSYINNLKAKGIPFDGTFIDTEYDRLEKILNIVNLPHRVQGDTHINTLNMPKNLKCLYNDFEDLCYSNDSALLCVNAYSISSHIVSALVEKLFTRCLVEDVTIPTLLYIDTEEFVADLSSLIAKSKNEGVSPRIRNSLETIYEYIYTARYVFWDRFRLDFPEYFKNYIYEIIKGRYNDCLGNMFITNKPYKIFMESLDFNTVDVLNVSAGIYDLSLEQRERKIILVKEEVKC